jgi:predicted metal-dependent peptidase
MFNTTLTTKERLTKLKIQLQESKPFWAFLILKMIIKEDVDNKLPPWGQVGVSKDGVMLYKKDYIDSLDDNHVTFLLAHEVGHLLLHHLTRLGNRDPLLFNIASDIALNYILKLNEYHLPDHVLDPDIFNHSIKVFDVEIKELDKKSAEVIYDEFRSKSKMLPQIISECVMDFHGYGEESNDKQGENSNDKWKRYMVEAATYAKMKGNLPNGVEMIVGQLLNPKHNWKYLLRRYINNVLPNDYSFSRPNLKICEVILPGVVKESIELVVHIDTSGSICDEELVMFLSEIMSIANSHRNVNITLIECDCEIQKVIEVKSYNKQIIKQFKCKGRGGTSHKPIWEWVKKNKNRCKLLISMTDLYSDVSSNDKPNYDVVFVVPKGGSYTAPFGRVLKL